MNEPGGVEDFSKLLENFDKQHPEASKGMNTQIIH